MTFFFCGKKRADTWVRPYKIAERMPLAATWGRPYKIVVGMPFADVRFTSLKYFTKKLCNFCNLFSKMGTKLM